MLCARGSVPGPHGVLWAEELSSRVWGERGVLEPVWQQDSCTPGQVCGLVSGQGPAQFRKGVYSLFPSFLEKQDWSKETRSSGVTKSVLDTAPWGSCCSARPPAPPDLHRASLGRQPMPRPPLLRTPILSFQRTRGNRPAC